MAIRDLTINQGKLKEEKIEKLVKPYILYDIEQKKVFFLPNGQKLGLKKRIILFLVAIKGWQFFEELRGQRLDEAKPKEIAISVFSNRSTVRNHLQTLKKDGIIHRTRKGNYLVPDHMLDEVEKMIIQGAKKGGEK